MNVIGTEQNSAKQLDRLAAQRQLYASAKKILALQVWVSGPLAVVLAFVGIFEPSSRGYIGLWTILVVMFDAFWLTPWQKRLRERAAAVQELFDCDVLGLPWNDLKAGQRPDPELIREQSSRYRVWEKTMPPLENWYSTAGGDLPPSVARVACQRSNCWWDSEQRRRYAAVVAGCVSLLLVIVLAIAITKKLSFEELLVTVLVPMTPLFVLGIRQYSEQREAAGRVDRLKEHASRLWADTLFSERDADVALRASRNLQDEIFESRRRSPLVFDVVFKRLRSRLERQMNYGAEDLFREARERLHHNRCK